MSARLVLREALASGRAQRVVSSVTAMLMAAATVTVMMTAGRNAASVAEVLQEIDQVGTRTLTVRAKSTASGFDSHLLTVLRGYDVVESATGLGTPRDVRNVVVPSRPPVAMVDVYGDWAEMTLQDLPRIAGVEEVWAAGEAYEILGISADIGALEDSGGPELLLTKKVDLPAYLTDLGAVIVRPHSVHGAQPISTLVVVADAPENLELVQHIVMDSLEGIPRDEFTVESSARLAELRAVISGALTQQSRSIVLGVLIGAAGSVLMTIWSLVLLRRRDFGRRRALGATRALILELIVAQVFFAAATGTAVGALLATGWLLASGHSPPPPAYVLAIAIALVVTAIAAAALPAIWASRRDPLSELRVA